MKQAFIKEMLLYKIEYFKSFTVTALKTWSEDAGTGKTCLPVSLAINNLEISLHTNYLLILSTLFKDFACRKEKCQIVTLSMDLQH